MDNKSTVSGGVGLFTLLLILFVGLKLGNVINWSWFWVLSPLWGPVVIVVGVILIMLLAAFISGKIDERRTRKAIKNLAKKISKE